MSDLSVYARREVLFLLALSEDQARELSEDIRSCAASWGDSQRSLSASDTQPTPIIVRWRDVQRALDQARAALSAEHDRIVALRVNGHTEQAIAKRVGTSDSTTRRRFISTIDAILELLGGEVAQRQAQSKPPACLICGEQPRTRVLTYGAKVRGKPRPRTERQSALCEPCLRAAAERAGAAMPETTTLIEREAA